MFKGKPTYFESILIVAAIFSVGFIAVFLLGLVVEYVGPQWIGGFVVVVVFIGTIVAVQEQREDSWRMAEKYRKGGEKV